MAATPNARERGELSVPILDTARIDVQGFPFAIDCADPQGLGGVFLAEVLGCAEGPTSTVRWPWARGAVWAIRVKLYPCQ